MAVDAEASISADASPVTEVDAGLPRLYKWRLLALLTMVYACHAMDRAVTSVVLEPIKREFRLNDSQLGALGGLTHGIAFCLFVLPVGWLADRTNRRNLLASLLAVWSGMTFAAGLAGGYLTLLLVRFGVGAAEAGGGPVSMSLVADVFPPRQRPTAIGFLYLGLAAGQGLIFFFGGYVAQHYGWRPVYFIAGAPGLILAVLLLKFARETKRGAVEGLTHGEMAPPRAGEILRAMVRIPALIFATIGITLSAVACNAVWVWMASLLGRIHHFQLGTIGLVLAIAAGICSGIGSVTAGPIAGAAVRRGGTAALGLFAGVVTLVGTPLGFGAIFAASPALAIASVIGLGFTFGAWLPPSFSLVLAISPPHMRASILSIVQLATNFFALALAPLLVGMLSDLIGGANSLVFALGAVFSVLFLAALCFLVAAWLTRRAELSGSAGS